MKGRTGKAAGGAAPAKQAGGAVARKDGGPVAQQSKKHVLASVGSIKGGSPPKHFAGRSPRAKGGSVMSPAVASNPMAGTARLHKK